MTRKELIKLIRSYSKYYIEDVANGVRYNELADAILALPIEVPGDELLRDKCQYEFDSYELQIASFVIGQWMRDEIIKRNRP